MVEVTQFVNKANYEKGAVAEADKTLKLMTETHVSSLLLLHLGKKAEDKFKARRVALQALKDAETHKLHLFPALAREARVAASLK